MGDSSKQVRRMRRKNQKTGKKQRKPTQKKQRRKIEERLKRPAYPRLWQETKHKSLGGSPVKAREKRLYLPQSGLEGHQNLVLRTKKRSEKTFPRQVSFFMFKANGRPPSRVSAMAARQTDRQTHPKRVHLKREVHQHVKRHWGIEPRSLHTVQANINSARQD